MANAASARSAWQLPPPAADVADARALVGSAERKERRRPCGRGGEAAARAEGRSGGGSDRPQAAVKGTKCKCAAVTGDGRGGSGHPRPLPPAIVLRRHRRQG